MEYKRFGDVIALRLEVGERVVESIAEVCRREDVRFASISGLGATNDATVGVLDLASKQFVGKRCQGTYEIGSLTGNATRRDGEPYLHLHIVFGNPTTGECYCGHLTDAVISATAEIVIQVAKGEVGRRLDESVGLNLWSM